MHTWLYQHAMDKILAWFAAGFTCAAIAGWDGSGGGFHEVRWNGCLSG